MKKHMASLTAEGIAWARALETRRPENERVCNDPYAEKFFGGLVSAFDKFYSLLISLFKKLGIILKEHQNYKYREEKRVMSANGKGTAAFLIKATLALIILLGIVGCSPNEKTSLTVQSTADQNLPETVTSRLDGNKADSMNQLAQELGIKLNGYLFDEEEAWIKADIYNLKLNEGKREFSIIRVSDQRSMNWCYLFYEKVTDAWVFKGHVELSDKRGIEPIFDIEEYNNGEGSKIWFVIRKITGYGTGIFEESEFWYSIEGPKVKEDLNYIIKRDLWMWPTGLAFTNINGNAKCYNKVVPRNREAKEGFYIEVQYHIKFTDGKALSYENEEDAYLFTAQRVVRYSWNHTEKRFVFDRENSSCDHAVFNTDAKSIMQNYKDELEQLSKSKMPFKTEWLRRLKN